jgi:hypothetical protein
MKKIGEYTTRGSILADDTISRVILDDGNFKTGYKITEFLIAPHDMDNTNARIYSAKLLVNDEQTPGLNWNWDRNGEIGWAQYSMDANSSNGPNQFSLIDPDNLVIQDLYIIGSEFASDIKLNYFIRMEKYDITDSQGALAMVRNRSQA